MPLCSLTEKFELQGPIEKIFGYLSDTDQISHSFPPSLKLQIIRRTSRRLSQNSAVEFKAKIFLFPIRWKSYVHSFSAPRHFAYTWQKGSLISWEHDFYFESISWNQTRITECILYRLPLGFLGSLANRILVRPYLKSIFAYRRHKLIQIFKTPQGDPSETTRIQDATHS